MLGLFRGELGTSFRPATASQYLGAVFSEFGDHDRAQIARQVLGA